MAEYTYDEPLPGSIVTVWGPTGTAWQRFFSDGLWHSTTGLKLDWAGLMAINSGRPINLVIHYRATEEDQVS